MVYYTTHSETNRFISKYVSENKQNFSYQTADPFVNCFSALSSAIVENAVRDYRYSRICKAVNEHRIKSTYPLTKNYKHIIGSLNHANEMYQSTMDECIDFFYSTWLSQISNLSDKDINSIIDEISNESLVTAAVHVIRYDNRE